MTAKVIKLPTDQRRDWEVRFRTRVRARINGFLPFVVTFGPDVSTAKVQAETMKQARYIVSQHLPVDEWID